MLGIIFAPLLGDLGQSEKISEIKPPLNDVINLVPVLLIINSLSSIFN